VVSAAPRAPSAPASQPKPTKSERTRSGWRSETAISLGVFLLAASLRLGSLDLAAFTFDDADIVRRAREIAAGRLALEGGMTSWGIPDPPLLAYLHATVARLPNPALASLALMALLNSLLVVATYLFAARYFGRRLALISSLLLAVNPWAIFFGRRAWVEVQPVLTLAAVWCSFEVAVRGRLAFALPFFLALSAGVQARLLALCYAPAALACLALGGRAWLTRWTVLGVVGGVLLGAPYGLFLLQNQSQIFAALQDGDRGVASAPAGNALLFAWWFASGLNLLPTPADQTSWLDLLGFALSVEAVLVGVLLVSGLALCLVVSVRRAEGWRPYGLLLAWVVLPLALLAWQSSTVYLHYLVILVPLIFLVAALPLERLLRLPGGQWAGLALLLAMLLPQLATWIVLQRTLMIYDTDEAVEARLEDRRVLAELERVSGQLIGTGEVYGVQVPLRYWLAIAERVRAAVTSLPREVLIATTGSNPRAEELPAMLEAVLGAQHRPRYQRANTIVLPIDRPALLVVTSDVEPAVPPEKLGQQRALVPLPTLARNTRDGTRLYDLRARPVSRWLDAVGASSLSSRSAESRLVGARAPREAKAGETIEVLTLWRGASGSLRPQIGLADGQAVLSEEQEDPGRTAAEVNPGQLMIVKHELVVPGRTRPGEYRLLASASPSDPSVHLARLTVATR
jgi:4-amino-4-deoxy-L-arabinose transferase-like glycosyltransferase